MKNNLEKIYALKTALENIGIDTELELDAVWFGSDSKEHYGIELYTNIPSDCDCVSFLFTPEGKHIYTCLEAPIRK